jgi:hypothetical protein
MGSCNVGQTYEYPFNHQNPATLGPDSTWMGDHPNKKYAGADRRCTHILWPGKALEDNEMSLTMYNYSNILPLSISIIIEG